MNCKCFEQAAEKLAALDKYDNREILTVDTPNRMWCFNESGGEDGQLSYEEFEVELEGLKKHKKVKIAHTFCPYCGKHAGKLTDEIKAKYAGLKDLNNSK